jgi:hypothetical protein
MSTTQFGAIRIIFIQIKTQISSIEVQIATAISTPKNLLCSKIIQTSALITLFDLLQIQALRTTPMMFFVIAIQSSTGSLVSGLTEFDLIHF